MSTHGSYSAPVRSRAPQQVAGGNSYYPQTYSSAAAPIEAPISEITALDVVCAVVAVLVATASGVGFAVSIFYFLFI